MSCGKPCNCASYRDHCLSVGISMNGMPTRAGRVTLVNETDKAWARDGDAYTRLRRQGYQPAGIDGCAELETRATEPIEIEMGKVYGDKAKYATEVDATIKESMCP